MHQRVKIKCVSWRWCCFFPFSPVELPPPAPEPQIESWPQNQTRRLETESTLQEASEAGLFFGRSFLLVGFGTDAEAQLSVLVTENGGRVLVGRTRVVADYAVVPLLGCSVEATVDEVVTDTWLVWFKSLLFASLIWIKSNSFHCLRYKVDFSPYNVM